MARIKLEVPATTIAVVQVPVRITDINYGNHVGNDAFVGIIHEARMQWLAANGYTELDIEGIGLIMSDIVVEFRNESFYGDTINATLSIGEITKAGFELYYRLSTKRNNTDIILANAKTGMICFDYTVKKVVALPEKLKLLLGASL